MEPVIFYKRCLASPLVASIPSKPPPTHRPQQKQSVQHAMRQPRQKARRIGNAEQEPEFPDLGPHPPAPAPMLPIPMTHRPHPLRLLAQHPEGGLTGRNIRQADSSASGHSELPTAARSAAAWTNRAKASDTAPSSRSPLGNSASLASPASARGSISIQAHTTPRLCRLR